MQKQNSENVRLLKQGQPQKSLESAGAFLTVTVRRGGPGSAGGGADCDGVRGKVLLQHEVSCFW